MIKKLTAILLMFIILGIGVLLGGCSNSSSGGTDIVYRFSGAKGVGDFIDVTLNLSNNTYSYEIRDGVAAGEKGSGNFQLIGASGSGPYEITSGNVAGEQFVLLDDDILLISDNEGAEGEKLITALKRSSVDYAAKIDEGILAGEYHIATSLEGYVGTVTIPDGSAPDKIKIDLGTNGLLSLPYSYNQELKALELIEEDGGDDFRHYGVFTSNYSLGVFDSYINENDGSGWQGDGMAILVKKGTYSLSDYVGTYKYMDVDGRDSYMTFEIRENGGTLELWADGETLVTGLTDNEGRIDFNEDLLQEGTGPQDWHILLLPDKMMVIASDDPYTFGGDGGGLGIGVKVD